MEKNQSPLLLTGVTGIIGRHVLYEIMQDQRHRARPRRVVVVARSSEKKSAAERIRSIVEHPQRPDYLGNLSWKDVESWIEVWDIQNAADKQIWTDRFQTSGHTNLTVIHMASTTNLSTLAETEDEIYKHSYLPTIALLEASQPYAETFAFVSTAFSTGHRNETIDNQYLEVPVRGFRNFYEAFKNRAEKYVRSFCEKHGIGWKILRPGIVSGRLIDTPLFYTPKFNVFYAWAGVFAVLQQKGIDCQGVRIAADPEGGLNIVPCDYVAKAIVKSLERDDIQELNIVHSHSFPQKILIPALLGSVGIQKFQFVENPPQEALKIPERIYYKTAGLQFTPYLVTPKHRFDTTKLRSLMSDCEEPSIENYFSGLLHYATERQFQDEPT